MQRLYRVAINFSVIWILLMLAGSVAGGAYIFARHVSYAAQNYLPELDVTLFKIDYPVIAYRSGFPPQTQATVSAQAVYALDVQSGTSLYSYNATLARHPASVTKLMTAVLSRDLYYLDQVLDTDLSQRTLGTVIDFVGGESQTVRSLLKAALIQSGNDAATILAERHPQGYSAFIQAMNDTAKKLKLEQTTFTNPTGLDDVGHKMSAKDVTTLFAFALRDTFLRETLSQSSIEIFDSTGDIKRTLYTTNQLLFSDTVLAGKTGTTELAGQVLTSLVTIDGHEVIITVMGSSDRYADTIAVYDWISETYTWVDGSELNLVH